MVDDTLEELAALEQLHHQEDLLLGLVDLVEPDGDLVFDDPLDVDLLGNSLLGIKYNSNAYLVKFGFRGL